MTKKSRFFSLRLRDVTHIYEIKHSYECAPQEGRLTCPCCDKPLRPVADFIQYGIFDDSYLTYTVCDECHWAVEFVYKIANYDLVPKREQKQLGIFLSKKIPTKSGSGA